MTEPTERGKPDRLQLKLLGALLVASGLAGLAMWLLFLPVPTAPRLTPFEPPPELLDKPHRHLAPAPPGSPSAAQ